jgi:DNA polymerase III epsilon subunit-like protein
LDIETTGLNIENHQILEIAAIVVQEMPRKLPRLEEFPFPNFHCLVKHDTIVGDAYALQMNAKILAELAGAIPSSGIPVFTKQEVVDRLSTFLRNQLIGDQRKYTVAGKNVASFDIPFLNKLNSQCPYEPHKRFAQFFGHRMLDVGNQFWGPSIDGFEIPNFEACLSRANMTASCLHRAFGDAYDVLRLLHARWSWASSE